MKNILCFCVGIIMWSAASLAVAGAGPRAFVEGILIAEGLDPTQVKSMIYDPRVSVNPDIIIKNLFYSSPKGSGKRPDVMAVSQAQIKRAKAFMKDHEDVLSSVEKRFGTSPRVITAILLIESRLGTYKMPYNVASAYANLAFMMDPDYLKEIQTLYAKDYPLLNDEATLIRARRKAKWAAGELVYLVYIANHLNIDPVSISGSFAGAMGPAQFIPSSFWIFGGDADGDGLASPFNMADAKFSMGRYLKKFGWRENASDDEKRKALWHYNRSSVYVNTVMMIYETLALSTY